MYAENDLLPLSALQHLLFCKRQCALIHIEQMWEENRYTAEGRILHDRVDSGRGESRKDVRLAFSVPLRSLRLGIVGKADVAEFHRHKSASGKTGRVSSRWCPFPVEYKRGRPKKKDWDRVQLCAQAICLEEMLSVEVPKGALFYGKTRRRVDVVFDAELRRKTEDASRRLHELIGSDRTPPPVYTKVCDRCSFLDLCLPDTLEGRKSVRKYMDDLIGGT